MLMLYLYQSFISLLGHHHFFLHFLFTFMENLLKNTLYQHKYGKERINRSYLSLQSAYIHLGTKRHQTAMICQNDHWPVAIDANHMEDIFGRDAL